MVVLNKFFSSVVLAVIYASSVMAFSAKHMSHRRRALPNGLTLETYSPPRTYEVIKFE
jgi:extracellular elastinolytic metalloproteinase